MDIESLVKREAHDEETPHDKIYARALRRAWGVFEGMSPDRLRMVLAHAREEFRQSGGTHDSTAKCIVAYAMLQEAEKEAEDGREM